MECLWLKVTKVVIHIETENTIFDKNLSDGHQNASFVAKSAFRGVP